MQQRECLHWYSFALHWLSSGVWSASIICRCACIFHDQISRSEHYRIMYRIWVRKLQVNCFIYKSWFLFRHISKKRPFFGVCSVFLYRIEFWRLIDFEPGECLLKLCEFPLTREHMSSTGLLNPLKGSSSEVTVTYVHIGFQSITSAYVNYLHGFERWFYH